MAKVGITTIHRIYNYGSVLQAYALQKTIFNMGHDCEVIDYLYPNSYHVKKHAVQKEDYFSIKYIKKMLGVLVTKYDKRKQIFSNFISDYLNVSEFQYKTVGSLRLNPPLYDIYVTGSDQVWNPTYMKYDPTFLLEFAPKKSKKISYAASFGNSSIDQHYVALYRKYLRAFSDISVRETAGMKIVADLINRQSFHVLDPTLLLKSDIWTNLAVKPKQNKKYILCYCMGYAYNPQPYADLLAKEFMKITGYDLVFMTPGNYKDKMLSPKVHMVFDAGPREFLGWFANAEIVLTSSFHGTAFSIIFNKPFLSLVNDMPTLDCRQKDLLEDLHLHEQILRIRSSFPGLSRLNPNFIECNKRLENARIKSIYYLDNALKSR